MEDGQVEAGETRQRGQCCRCMNSSQTNTIGIAFEIGDDTEHNITLRWHRTYGEFQSLEILRVKFKDGVYSLLVLSISRRPDLCTLRQDGMQSSK